MESTVNCWNKTNNGPKLGKNTKTKIQQETMNMLFFLNMNLLFIFLKSVSVYTLRDVDQKRHSDRDVKVLHL